jgi:hypothetical protein
MNGFVENAQHPGLDETGRFALVAEVYKGGYSWDLAAVWRDKTTGKLYGDTDGGCSCYGPWDPAYMEDQTLSGCAQITHVREAAELLKYISGEEGDVTTTERQDFVRKVEVALASA